MSHSNTAFHQLLKPLLRHEFEAEAKKHHVGQKLRSATRWDQFVGMASRNCLAVKACAIFNPIPKRSSINSIISVNICRYVKGVRAVDASRAKLEFDAIARRLSPFVHR